jgi:hypothetical protein
MSTPIRRRHKYTFINLFRGTAFVDGKFCRCRFANKVY